MKVKISKKYLDTLLQFEIEGNTLTEALFQASIFTNKDKCILCGNDQIALIGNKTQEGYLYIKRQCTNSKCRATSKLGTYKDGNTYFWHKWEIWSPENKEVTKTQEKIVNNNNSLSRVEDSTPSQSEPNYSDDMPF
jgi:hypothetical protein